MSELNYRDRIYKNYASNFQDTTKEFNANAAENWSRPYYRYFRNWLPLDKGSRILEVACGGGRFLYFLKKMGFNNLDGVDLSPEQTALSKQVIPSERVHECNAINYLKTQFETFDLLVGLDLIEHLSKHECLEFIDACHNALCPGGRLILQTPNGESPWAGHMRYGDFTHEIGFTPNSLVRLLRMAGFVDIEVRETGPVAHGAVSFLRALGWALLRLPLMAWNLIEIGNVGSGIYTRVMLVSAKRPAK